MSPEKKKAMIRRGHPALSISRQCRLMKLSRSAFSYAPVGIAAATLVLMKAIARVFTKYPFFGSRQIAAYLRRDGIVAGRHRVRRLMTKMGLEAIYKRPRTSQPHPQYPVYPYLLRKMVIDRPDQVWCADITFIPVKRGFPSLVAIVDWATRKMLSWRLSNTMHADFCVEALRRHRPVRPARDREHRPGQPVHRIGLDHHADRGRGAHLDEWARPLHGQHLHRTALALAQAGGGLSRRNRRRLPGPAGDQQLDDILQHRTFSLFP